MVAVGNSMLTIAWHLLSDPTATFEDLGADYYAARINPERRARNLAAALEAVTGQKIVIHNNKAIIIKTAPGWQTGATDLSGLHSDGAGLLTVLCDGTSESYRAFAADYYEVELDPAATSHVYAGLPLTDHIVGLLNPEVGLADVSEEITAINESRRA